MPEPGWPFRIGDGGGKGQDRQELFKARWRAGRVELIGVGQLPFTATADDRVHSHPLGPCSECSGGLGQLCQGSVFCHVSMSQGPEGTNGASN